MGHEHEVDGSIAVGEWGCVEMWCVRSSVAGALRPDPCLSQGGPGSVLGRVPIGIRAGALARRVTWAAARSIINRCGAPSARVPCVPGS